MSWFKDARALGVGAAPRAMYEVSKRAGSHRLLFRAVTATKGMRSTYSTQIPSRSSPSAQLCVQDAKRILDEGLLVFGRRFPVKSASDWITDPESGNPWPQQPWWTIDIRSDRRLGDVKWVWEMGRHRELVVLARAASIEGESTLWADHLDRLLMWWFEANPLERSVHWYSNLEVALRLIAWNQILALAGARLSRQSLDLMSTHVAQMRRHLWRDLLYTVSSMRNNHMLGDSLGLGVADAMTDSHPSKLRARIANGMWHGQLARQVKPDGSMIEDSLSYHRFVLEMLCARYLMTEQSPQLAVDIGKASRYLADLGALEGPVPQYGDWDEGRVLTSSGNPLDVGNSVALGLAIAGEPEAEDWRTRFDLLDWYLPQVAPTSSKGRVVSSPSRKAGEILMTQRGPWRVWMKCGSGPSHGHADLGHVSARYRDEWVLVDPGTGTYNGSLEVRNGFRISQAHNVLRPIGEGQIEPHRAFRWMSSPTGVAGRIHELVSATVLWGVHDAYIKRNPSSWPWRLARVGVVTEAGIVIIDWREGGPSEYELTIPFHPSCAVELDAVELDGDRLSLSVPGQGRIAQGEQAPFLGWYSETYGSWNPAPWIVSSGSLPGPLIWSLGNVKCETEANCVRVGGVGVHVSWSETGPTLEILNGEQVIHDSVMLGRPL